MVTTNLRRVCFLSGIAIVFISGVIGCRSGKVSNPFVRNDPATTNTATPPAPPPGVTGTPVNTSSSFLGGATSSVGGTSVGTTIMPGTTTVPGTTGSIVGSGPIVPSGSVVPTDGAGVVGSTSAVMTPMPNPSLTTNPQSTTNPSLSGGTSDSVSSYRVPTGDVSPVSVALPVSTVNSASPANAVTLENTMRSSSVVTSAGQSVASEETHTVGYSNGGSSTPSGMASVAGNVPTNVTGGVSGAAGNGSGIWNGGNPQNVADGTPVENTYTGTASGSVQSSAMPTGQPLDTPIPGGSTDPNGSKNSNGTTTNPSANASSPSGTTTVYYPNESGMNHSAGGGTASDSTASSMNAAAASTDAASSSATGAIPDVLKQLGQTEHLELVSKPDGIHLTVEADRLFTPRTTDWTIGAKPLVENIWKTIQTAVSELSPDSKIQVIGYTDSSLDATGAAGNGTPGEESRRLSELSAKQASAMRDLAVTTSNFAQDRFEILGRGDSDPRFSNGTEKGRAGNRRLEIVLPQKNT
ncbi:MAG: OmpA family protein [Thermoguttaceae bacterium]|nr:OmpA family protein [Thermoguttaceae bacterium]